MRVGEATCSYMECVSRNMQILFVFRLKSKNLRSIIPFTYKLRIIDFTFLYTYLK